MKFRTGLFVFALALAISAMPASGQDVTAFMTPTFVEGTHPLKKSGMPAVPRLFISTLEAHVISDMLTGGRGAGPSLRFAAAMGTEIGRDAVFNRAKVEQPPTLERAGFDRGVRDETSQYLRGQVVGIRGVQWDETMKSIIGDKLDKLGATLNDADTGDSCTTPGERVLCLVVGQLQPVDDDQRYGSFNSGFWGATASSNNAQWRQRHELAFSVKVMDTRPDGSGSNLQPVIATARGIGSAGGFQHHHIISANGTAISQGQSHQDYQRLALLDALLDALGKIEWRQSALEYLSR